MKISTLFYTIKQGFVNIFRNKWYSLASIATISACLFLFGLFFMLKGIEGKRRYLYISMIFYALCMYSYGISFYTVPVFLLAACIYMLVKKVIGWKEAGISVGVYALVSWPIYTTMAINTLGKETIHTPFFTIPYFPDSVRSQDILFFADDKWEQLQTNVKSVLSVFLEGDTLPWNTICLLYTSDAADD